MMNEDLESFKQLKGFMVMISVSYGSGKHPRTYQGELKRINHRHISITNRAGYSYRFETENILAIEEVEP